MYVFRLLPTTIKPVETDCRAASPLLPVCIGEKRKESSSSPMSIPKALKRRRISWQDLEEQKSKRKADKDDDLVLSSQARISSSLINESIVL